ncbi:hypothetical protein [Falsiroseomonas oryziterrae]|uniref:hypothetical protein n=1 Tax=Falsiroseomonas oryziterrae TaxID=2911368 RepID=UPI001F25EF6F|nr:hypothetical protein [Roseomonas sp. NPKOSM-4]
MPNFDGGHYFLTALIPVKTTPTQDPRASDWVTSHTHCLREALASMPTALQTWATEGTGINSPFARDPRTHFARLVVLDDVAFNGRDHQDAIVTALKAALGSALGRRIEGGDPTQPRPVDHLPHPYLIFVCDFDAASGEPGELEGYLRGLWSVMDTEWHEILQHCHGYDRAQGAEGFARLIMRCQVETTMPFNDYYHPFPALPSMSLGPVVAPLAVAAVLLVVGLLGGLLTAWFGGRGAMWWWAALIGLVGVPLAGVYAYRAIVSRAQAPLPTGHRADLVSVVKALYLQQAFTRFAIAHQGASPAALHAAFGAFLRTHRPEDPTAPTQPRGVVRSDIRAEG